MTTQTKGQSTEERAGEPRGTPHTPHTPHTHAQAHAQTPHALDTSLGPATPTVFEYANRNGTAMPLWTDWMLTHYVILQEIRVCQYCGSVTTHVTRDEPMVEMFSAHAASKLLTNGRSTRTVPLSYIRERYVGLHVAVGLGIEFHYPKLPFKKHSVLKHTKCCQHCAEDYTRTRVGEETYKPRELFLPRSREDINRLLEPPQDADEYDSIDAARYGGGNLVADSARVIAEKKAARAKKSKSIHGKRAKAEAAAQFSLDQLIDSIP